MIPFFDFLFFFILFGNFYFSLPNIYQVITLLIYILFKIIVFTLEDKKSNLNLKLYKHL
jgi:hypothetical protein